jgi:hypothetical protein
MSMLRLWFPSYAEAYVLYMSGYSDRIINRYSLCNVCLKYTPFRICSGLPTSVLDFDAVLARKVRDQQTDIMKKGRLREMRSSRP